DYYCAAWDNSLYSHVF
nr:immunoglobulin light chain junction region [Macaca mulatta]MOV96175.1 immunoglobulin light chain junction region [Macaca mulatta]MOV96708.1 immunoglobulin light chain junction region [Macaca mulatta]MOV96886.1 immunoglobulin light chain junction region [Macaca mulatta]MOV96954.1 immunoglobulin light chain junction region [Macaca mulatta]